jgi:tetratricopeptide (TPR) repeat protein
VDLYPQLDANAIWDLIEGDPVPRRHPTGASPPAVAAAPAREQLVLFWAKQHAAMDALKRESDIPKATALFREAVALNPAHEDSRYYLANCLYAQGDTAGALAQLDELIRTNPQSHRGYQRRGLLLAASANSKAQLTAAEAAVNQALALNPEETGTLLLLGEIALLKGDARTATERLELACRTNPRATGGFFLRGYIAWKSNDSARARELLLAAKNTRAKDWKPAGTVAEGDVRARMHTEGSVLSQFWERWDGAQDPAVTYARLNARLTR